MKNLTKIFLGSIFIVTLASGVEGVKAQNETTVDQCVNIARMAQSSGEPISPHIINIIRRYCLQGIQQYQRQLKMKQCFAIQQRQMAERSTRMSQAMGQGGSCSTDACRDYWNIKEQEALNQSPGNLTQCLPQ